MNLFTRMTSFTVPIWKGKSDVSECTNYRPFRLLCHTMKIFEVILDGHCQHLPKSMRLCQGMQNLMLSILLSYSWRNIKRKTRKSTCRSWIGEDV